MKRLSLDELFKRQKQSLDHFFEKVNHDQIDHLLDLLAACKGTIFFTGVGKSGFIAHKISATLVSMGIKSMYLEPMNALHGDIGIVDSDDIFIFFSKSGDSDELLNLIPYIRNRNVPTVSVVSVKKCRLDTATDHHIFLPLDHELCPFGMIPTTSPELQLIFGDILAVALMSRKGLTLDKFALNHPAGKIGKRIALRVDEIMLIGQKVPVCSLNDKLIDVLVELTKKKCGCLMVVDKTNHLKGIFTDGDLRRALQKHREKVLSFEMKDLIIPNPMTILPEKLASEALKLMERNQKKPVMMLPVVDKNHVLKGLIKMHDLVQAGIG